MMTLLRLLRFAVRNIIDTMKSLWELDRVFIYIGVISIWAVFRASVKESLSDCVEYLDKKWGLERISLITGIAGLILIITIAIIAILFIY